MGSLAGIVFDPVLEILFVSSFVLIIVTASLFVSPPGASPLVGVSVLVGVSPLTSVPVVWFVRVDPPSMALELLPCTISGVSTGPAVADDDPLF